MTMPNPMNSDTQVASNPLFGTTVLAPLLWLPEPFVETGRRVLVAVAVAVAVAITVYVLFADVELTTCRASKFGDVIRLRFRQS